MVGMYRQYVHLADADTALTRRLSLASLVAAALATFTLAGAPTASAQEGLAASCEPPAEETLAGTFDEIHAQTFTSALTGSLTRGEISVANGTGSNDWVVEIRAVNDSTSAPTAVVLAAVTVPDADVPTDGSLLSVVFASPPMVVAGEQYAIAVSNPGPTETSWASQHRSGDDCPGAAWRSPTGQSWQPGSDFDMVFRAFVTPPPPASATCKGKEATHVGTPGEDVLLGTDGPDVIAAQGGNDKIKSQGGKDLICAGDGEDVLKGANGADRLFGEGGEDRVFGGAGKDALRGGSGDDRLDGHGNGDNIKGNRGDDKLGGGGGSDSLSGNNGEDRLFGQGSNDSCNGGGGRDKEKSC